MMKGIFTLVFCLLVGFVFGQATGDFQSHQSGLWSSTNSWERYNGASWIYPAPSTPNNTSGVITILNGHIITVGTSVATDQTVVAVGGTLRVSSSTLTIFNTAGNQLTVNGTLETILGTVTRSPLISTSVIQVNGIVNNNGSITNTTAARMFFNSGSVYNHQNTAPAGSIPLATWNSNSTCAIVGNINAVPANINQSFWHFDWNTPVLAQDLDLNGGLTTVRGNLSFSNTGGSAVYFTLGTAYTLAVTGNLSVSSGSSVALVYDQNSTINVGGNFSSAGTVVGSYDVGNATLNVTGNISLTGGTFDAGVLAGGTNISVAGSFTNSGTSIIKSEAPATSPLNVTFNGTGVQNFTSTHIPTFPVNYATTNTSNLTIAATSYLAGPGGLTVGIGTSLTLLSLNSSGALQNGVAGGNVQVTGTRTYTGTIVYGASARQYMSTQHPGSVNTRINNAGGVSMLGSVAFTGVLDLDNGLLRIENGATLTVASVLHNGGFMGINSSSNIVINGTGAYGNLALTHLSGNRMNNLTINRAGSGVVTQATPRLTIVGTLTLASGQLALGANTTTTVRSNFGVTAGTMSGVNTSNLSISGSGTLPAAVLITGSLGTLSMNRSSQTLNLSNTSLNNLNVTLLNLTRGNVNNAGGLRMANNGLITRTDGVLTAAIGAVGVYDVTYGTFSATNTNTGFEIPNAPSVALRNLILNTTGARTLTLTKPIDAAGNISVSDGTLVTNNFPVSTGGNFIVAAAASFTPGTSTLTFDGSTPQVMTSATPLTMTNVLINKSATSTFTLTSALNITNSFGVITTAATANVGNNLVTLISTAASTAYVPTMPTGGAIVGSVIVQRQLPNTQGIRAYRYIAPSTTNATVADWQTDFPITGTFTNPSTGTYNGTLLVPNSPSLFYYNETLVTGAAAQGAGYVKYPNGINSAAAPLVSGRGYAAYFRTTTTPSTYDTRGTLGQGDVPVNVTRGNGANSGWNLIGNPYPTPIDWDNVILASTGVNNAIYFTDNTQNSGSLNVSYVGGVANPGTFNSQIAAGQAFWVRVTNPSSSGTVNFRETQKAPVQTQFYREGEIPNLLRVVMKKGTLQDEIALRIHDDATSDFDAKYDAYKFGAAGLYISSLTKNNDRLSINSIGRGGCNNTVPLLIDGGSNGTYDLNFSGIETFDADVKLILNDKVENKRVELATSPHYSFSVSDVAALKDRFELIFEGPSVEIALALKGEVNCADNTYAYITLENSQLNVKYTANLNGTTVSSEFEGNGGELSIPVSVEFLPQGEQEITILAKMSDCEALPLSNKAKLIIAGKGVINSVEDGTSCSDGTVNLKATGSDATSSFNWYEDAADALPIADHHGSEFTTPALTKSKTYYVAAVNAAGCEGALVAVKATVLNLEQPVIAAEGNILTSSIAEGNQWYLDGLLIENATGKSLEAIISGVYTVKVTQGKCSTTSDGREMLVTGTEEGGANFISIFPNPTTDKVTVEVRSNNPVEARLIHASGKEINSVKLTGDNVKTGEFAMTSLPDGVYLLRIHEGHKVFTKKISKIK